MKARGEGRSPDINKVDLRLLDRRKALKCLYRARGTQKVNQVDIERLAGRLLALGSLAPATLVGALEQEDDPIVVELAAGTLEWMVETQSIDPTRSINTLKRLVISAHLPDSARMRLLVTLSRLGVDMCNIGYAGVFNDFAALAETSREEILSSVSSDESLLIKLVEEIAELPGEAQLSLIEDYAQSEQPVVFRLYRILGRSNDMVLGDSVVGALRYKATPAAVATLMAISQESLSLETRRRALRAMRELQFGGINAAPFHAPLNGPVFSSVVTTIDGAGNRMVWIAREKRRGSHLSAMHLMINDQEGIQDCFGCMKVAREEYNERLRALEEQHDVAVQEMDFDYCLGLVRDALACNQQHNIPVPPQFLLLMDIFSDRRLEPEPFVPTFEDQDLQALRSNETLIKRSADAIQMQSLRSWFSAAESLHPLALRANRLMDDQRPNTAFMGIVAEQMERMVCRIIHSELAPCAPVLRRRLEMMVDFFLRSSICSGDDALALLAAAQHLPSGSAGPNGSAWPSGAIPPEKNPLLFAIARRSLENAQATLRRRTEGAA